jgi:hypothetical protein
MQSFQIAGAQFKHRPLQIVLIGLTAIAYALCIFFNVASTFPKWGILEYSNAEISNNYTLSITPAGATFSTWGIIYSWTALWIIWAFLTIFLKTDDGFLYTRQVLPPVFFVLIIVNLLSNFGWLLVFSRPSSLYGAAIIAHRNSYQASFDLRRIYNWAYRILVNNGLAFYAAWVTVATLLNVTYVLQFSLKFGAEVSSIISLCILTILVAAYFAMDIYFFEKYLRYTFSHYVQLLIAFTGILAKNFSRGSASSYFALVLAIAVGILFLVKIVFSVLRWRKDRNGGSY